MLVPSTKMHGAGNNFVIDDCTLEPAPAWYQCRRFLHVRNPNSSEAGACGNATRYVANLLLKENGRPYQVIRTVAGDLPPKRFASTTPERLNGRAPGDC